MDKFFIGELSKRADVNIETIRYYERVSILPSPPRTDGGHRLYDDNHFKRLSFIRRSRELGFSLESIRQMLLLVDGGEVTCEQVNLITLSHLADVRAKITDLKRMERILKKTASECSGGKTPDCPIIDSLFAQP